MNKHINLDKLNEHLFEAIEMLKNNNDPKASDNEKIDLNTAKTIADLAKVAVESFKVKVQALGIISKSENPNTMKESIKQLGIDQ